MTRLQKVATLVGFVALTVALVAAISQPSKGSELSIYRSTPIAFWVGVGIALLLSLVVSVGSGRSRRVTGAGLLLAASSIWSIVTLPLVRGYFFYGGGDSLSHLGFARMFASNAMSPLDLLHPGVHLVSLFVSATTGFRLGRSMVFSVFLFFLVFFVFLPLVVRQITGSDRGAVLGLFLALLLTPINNVSTHPVAHPTSQTILFVPFVLYLLFVYLRQPTADDPGVTPTGVLLAVTSVALVVFHPQEALSVLVIFGAVAGLQFVYRRTHSDHPISEHHPVYLQTALFTLVFILWSSGRPRVSSRFQGLYRSFFVSQPTPGNEVVDYTLSLASVGGSIEELFVKLFLVSFVLSAIAGLTMIATVSGFLDDVFPEQNAYNRYLTAAFVPLTVISGVVFLANFGDHYFRYIGFLMVLVTILAAAALAKGVPVVLDRVDVGVPAVRATILVLLVLLLPLAVLSIHPSPWIYQPTPQVSEAKMDGFQTTFAYREPNTTIGGIRGGPQRYVHAIYGPTSTTAETMPVSDAPIPPPVFGENLSTYYTEPRYIPVTETDIEREVGLYRGFRYGSEGFRTLETSRDIGRVYANPEFRLYFLRNERE